MATIGDLILRTEEIIYGTGLFERPTEDAITGNITDTATSMGAASNLWRKGDYAEFVPVNGSIDEVVYVAAESSGTLTIRRAQRGSTAAAQTSGDVIRKNPAVTRTTIGQKIEHVTNNELWPHVWSWHHDTLTFTTDDHLYNLDAYVEDVVRVYQSNINSDGRFAELEQGWWEVQRQLDTAVSTNRNLLRLGKVWDENATVYYTGKRRPFYADLANLDDRVADLIPYAAASHILFDRGPQIDGSSKRTGRGGGTVMSQHADIFRSRFNQMRDQYRRQLMMEVPSRPTFKHRGPRRW